MKKQWSGRGIVAAVLVACAGLAVPAASASAWAPPATAAPFVGTQGVKASDAELAKRLAELCEKLEKKRVEQHIPGMAIAVVKDGQVVLARGFGQRDMGLDGSPAQDADENTVFAIGSQTKAFTCMLVSMLADEGKMTWDDPVSKHVPGFKLFDKEANEKVTLRDLCSHRTGLPRTDLLWASGKASKQQMMERLAFAEPSAKFRQQWQYNNTMLMVAGMAAESAGHSTWPELIAARIFKPLGMTSSSTHISVMQKNPHAAKGYAWDKDASTYKVLPMREVTCDGAGAINSSATDMSNWLKMLLAKGEFNGARMVSSQMIAEMWKPEIPMGNGNSYGLGWMLGDWNGHRSVDHGGNIDGFFTSCAMLPDEHLGFVLMGSLTYAPLQGECLPMVWEAFFPPAPSESSMSDSQLQAYVGTYHAEMLNADTKINVKDGKLYFDVPGQTNYELKAPDADGKWAFAMMPAAIQLKFNRNDKGEIESLTSFQGGLEMVLPKLGPDGKPLTKADDKPGPYTLEQLREFTGTYHFTPTDMDWKVIIKNGKLAVDVPKQMAFELVWPDESGKWKVAIAPKTMACSFERGASGKIESMTWYQGGELKLPRTGDGPGSDLPTIDQISALRMKNADPERMKAMGDMEVSGKVRAINQGVVGTVRAYANADGRSLQDIDFGDFGFIRASYDGKQAWTESVGEPFTEMTGDRLEEVRKAGSQFVIGDLRKLFDTVEVVEKSTLNGKDVVVIRGHTAKPEKASKQYLDAATGLPLKENTSVTIPGLGSMPMTITYEDYRDVEGVMFPTKVTIHNDANGSTEFLLDTVKTRVKLPADAYTLKPAAKGT